MKIWGLFCDVNNFTSLSSIFVVMKMIVSFLSFFVAIGCFAQQPKGDRHISWVVDMTENENYDSAMRYALSACMESIHLAQNWSALESSAGSYDFTLLDIAEIYYPAYNVEVELQIATINTVAKETPADLMSVAFDHPTMISRFKSLLDSIFVHMPNVTLTSLNIGNEHDVFMGIDASQYAAYKTFLDSVVPYAKQKYMALHGVDLTCGTTFTHGGLTSSATKALCQTVNQDLDIVAVTYYPLNNDFTMKDPSVVDTDFNLLVQNYSDTTQPIHFVECGYSSSTVCNSSEQKQSDFYKNVFTTWDDLKSSIKNISVFKSTDWSGSRIQAFKDYYGVQDTIFGEYLRTLGVRTWQGNGSNKLAYNTIKCELAKRNWCTVSCPNSSVASIASPKTTVYPNPTSGFIYIDTQEKIESINIYNSIGVLIDLTNLKNMDVSGLKPGLYYLQIIMNNQVEIKKFVKK